MPNRAERITRALAERFPGATSIEVADQSALHAGHAGARPAGETHYHVTMVADAFSGLSRVARSRAVHATLQAEFDTGLHALSLRLIAPGEQFTAQG